MSHARIEEVSDSDMSDPSEGDIDDFDETEILRSTRRSPAPPTTSSSSSAVAAPPPLVHHHPPPSQQHVKPEDIKDYQMLYPVYFDARRTRSGGRRVASSLAVANPLARTIASACAALRLSPVLEAHRTHPRDWANPGRVRVRLGPSSTSSSSSSSIKNKHHLYVLVARYLREHPTTEDSDALRRGVREFGVGLGLDDGGNEKGEKDKWPRPAVPRGWEKKMGDLLPAYSAAMTGGGVSENAFKEMMKEMQGAGAGGPGGGGMPGLPGGITPEMMNMFGGMGGMGGGGGGGAGGLGALAGLMGGMGGGGSDAGGGSGSGGGGGGKKGKKGKGKA
ncbi:signal recognition particle, SRP19 subunit [Biscogniauxia mediterranea]|nr:signal recognition particle, SRP19 subunit [Biscogniauxia mediterranea]